MLEEGEQQISRIIREKRKNVVDVEEAGMDPPRRCDGDAAWGTWSKVTGVVGTAFVASRFRVLAGVESV